MKSHDAINAIEAILAGRTVPVERTRVVGCSTKWSDKRADVGKSLAKWDAEPVSIESIDEKTLVSLMKNDGKKLRLVNVWATWCGPCVAEMEDLVTIHRMYRGRPFEMITISTDAPEKKDAALEVLTKHHLSAKNYIRKTTSDDKFAEALDKDWPGPVPYTLLVAPGGKVIYRKVGAFDPLELKRAIVGFTGRTY